MSFGIYSGFISNLVFPFSFYSQWLVLHCFSVHKHAHILIYFATAYVLPFASYIVLFCWLAVLSKWALLYPSTSQFLLSFLLAYLFYFWNHCSVHLMSLRPGNQSISVVGPSLSCIPLTSGLTIISPDSLPPWLVVSWKNVKKKTLVEGDPLANTSEWIIIL